MVQICFTKRDVTQLTLYVKHKLHFEISLAGDIRSDTSTISVSEMIPLEPFVFLFG